VWQLSQLLSLAMCPLFLPAAIVPLWHEKHAPTTCVWSTRVAGFQALVPWHFSQLLVLEMCVAFLPVAVVPLWQLAQLFVMPAWLKPVAGVHAVVL
jgi:hypothetical protein